MERFRENYTDRSTELVKAWFASMQRKHPEINTAVSDFIIHLHTVWMFTMFEELLMHFVPRQEMEAILHDYILFEIQGWRAYYQDMRYRQRTYEHSTASERLARRKSSRRFPPFFMNNSEYRSLLNIQNMKQKYEFKSIVAETLLIPLYMRAKESRRNNPILYDKAAEWLADSLEYDYSQFDGGKVERSGMRGAWMVF